MDWNNARMFETSGSFGLPDKTLQVRLGGPRAKANHLECHGAIETLLPGAKYHTLTTPTDHFQQFVITQLSQCVGGAGCFFTLASGSCSIRFNIFSRATLLRLPHVHVRR